MINLPHNVELEDHCDEGSSLWTQNQNVSMLGLGEASFIRIIKT